MCDEFCTSKDGIEPLIFDRKVYCVGIEIDIIYVVVIAAVFYACVNLTLPNEVVSAHHVILYDIYAVRVIASTLRLAT